MWLWFFIGRFSKLLCIVLLMVQVFIGCVLLVVWKDFFFGQCFSDLVCYCWVFVYMVGIGLQGWSQWYLVVDEVYYYWCIEGIGNGEIVEEEFMMVEL